MLIDCGASLLTFPVLLSDALTLKKTLLNCP